MVRYLDEDGNLLCELYGYDPRRFEWVRLSDPVNLGQAGNHMLAGVALFPMTLGVDAVALGTDLALLALSAAAHSGAGSGGFNVRM